LPHCCVAGYLRRLNQSALNAFCHKAVFYWYDASIAERKFGHTTGRW
jgi:hypothetical protein